MKYKIGQKVKLIKSECDNWDADYAYIKKIEEDPKGEYGSYLLENEKPLLLGWFNEDQFTRLDN